MIINVISACQVNSISIRFSLFMYSNFLASCSLLRILKCKSKISNGLGEKKLDLARFVPKS